MRGLARTYGAITIVNALWTGVGAAIAVDLPVDAEAEIAGADAARTDIEPAADTPLVRACVDAALRTFAPGESGVRLRLRSSVPIGRGLKSSSAVSAAVLRAVARAAGRDPDPVDLARLSSATARQIGLSATGAMDDALASLTGAGALTDNTAGSVLRTLEAPGGVEVVLWVPPGEHRPSPEWAERFRVHADGGRECVELARSGALLRAMERNGELSERVLGLPYAGLREELRRSGARASGVSGLGPSLAVLAPPERVSAVRQVLTGKEGRVLATRFVPRTGPPGDAR